MKKQQRFRKTTNGPNVDILIKDFVNTEKSVDIHTQNKPVNNIQSMGTGSVGIKDVLIDIQKFASIGKAIDVKEI